MTLFVTLWDQDIPTVSASMVHSIWRAPCAVRVSQHLLQGLASAGVPVLLRRAM